MGVESLRFYSDSRRSIKKLKWMGLWLIHVLSGWEWKLSRPLISVHSLSGNVFHKDLSPSHIFNCTEKSVFGGKQTVILFWSSWVSGTFMAEESDLLLRTRNPKGKDLEHLSFILSNVSFYPSNFSCFSDKHGWSIMRHTWLKKT